MKNLDGWTGYLKHAARRSAGKFRCQRDCSKTPEALEGKKLQRGHMIGTVTVLNKVQSISVLKCQIDFPPKNWDRERKKILTSCAFAQRRKGKKGEEEVFWTCKENGSW